MSLIPGKGCESSSMISNALFTFKISFIRAFSPRSLLFKGKTYGPLQWKMGHQCQTVSVFSLFGLFLVLKSCNFNLKILFTHHVNAGSLVRLLTTLYSSVFNRLDTFITSRGSHELLPSSYSIRKSKRQVVLILSFVPPFI